MTRSVRLPSRLPLMPKQRANRGKVVFALCLAFATCVLGGPATAQTVVLMTSAGDVRLELDSAKAPKTVANFLAYLKSGHYDGTVFHRVIPGFMIQGGGLTADLREKPTRAPVVLESRNGLTNVRGSVAMARTANPNSATAQFFINLADNTALDASDAADGNGYAVFGRVVGGMEVVDAIAASATGSNGPYDDVPLQAIVIKKVGLVR